MFIRCLGRIKNVCNNIILATDAFDVSSVTLKKIVTDINQILVAIPEYDCIEDGFLPAECVMALLENESENFVQQQPAGLKEGFESADRRPYILHLTQDTVGRLLVVLENYASIGNEDLASISVTREASDPDRVRGLVRDGWKIIDINMLDDSFIFVLGR